MLESDISNNIAFDHSATHGTGLPETSSNEDGSNIPESGHEHDHHHVHHEEDEQLTEGRISMQRTTVKTLKCLAVLMIIFIATSVSKAITIEESDDRISMTTQAGIGVVSVVGISDVIGSKIIAADRKTVIQDISSAEIIPVSRAIVNQIKVVDISAINEIGLEPITVVNLIAGEIRNADIVMIEGFSSGIAV